MVMTGGWGKWHCSSHIIAVVKHALSLLLYGLKTCGALSLVVNLSFQTPKKDGFNWKHRVYTLFPSSKTPGFLPSGSQAGIKRSKSWLDQDNLAKT